MLTDGYIGINNQEEIKIAFEMPPKSKTCRLVATEKVDDEFHLTVLDYENGFIYFKLSDIDQQREDIQSYIEELLPKILSGVYNTELVDMEKEEICV